ncbi:UNKNOWN [Stylonychia lemnae]|uniref:Uncharacterized protein n=1 Tax=Stylonychia lemnae TaxID=5949 RepID=A0A078AVT4_STYLE|nr:UNKNOWN [Stylonychia lemnae]|eukprot:CDW84883.1 UNKNOWN [Stylonychia lemnae]
MGAQAQQRGGNHTSSQPFAGKNGTHPERQAPNINNTTGSLPSRRNESQNSTGRPAPRDLGIFDTLFGKKKPVNDKKNNTGVLPANNTHNDTNGTKFPPCNNVSTTNSTPLHPENRTNNTDKNGTKSPGPGGKPRMLHLRNDTINGTHNHTDLNLTNCTNATNGKNNGSKPAGGKGKGGRKLNGPNRDSNATKSRDNSSLSNETHNDTDASNSTKGPKTSKLDNQLDDAADDEGNLDEDAGSDPSDHRAPPPTDFRDEASKQDKQRSNSPKTKDLLRQLRESISQQ